MTRLPELEQSLRAAAARLGDVAAPSTTDTKPRAWPVRRASWLAIGLALSVSGAALAASEWLAAGDAVPTAQPPIERPGAVDQVSLRVMSVRAEDPEGGPDWGLATYELEDKPVTCVLAGRVQHNAIGIIGRDGAFENDGQFHRLSADSSQSGICAGRTLDGDFRAETSSPEIPASGYSGSPFTPIGGCAERVRRDSPTISPETRRKLLGIPPCSEGSLRTIKYGFAGRSATRVTFANEHVSRTLKVDGKENGAYIFVLLPSETRGKPMTLTIE